MITSVLRKIAWKVTERATSLRTRWKDELVIQSDGLKLCYSTRSSVAKQWFYPRYASGNDLHEPPISHLIRSRLTANSTFYDVGANVGFFTVLAAKICIGSNGSVHAFEVDPSLIPLIEESLHLNETGSVYINCAACADQVGNLVSFGAVQANNPSTNQVATAPGGLSGRVGVQAVTITLDHYWSKSGASPDLIKIDVEGAEALTVPHMLQLVSNHRPELILEVHPSQVREFGAKPRDLIHMLQDAGSYQVFEISSYRENHERLENTLAPLTPERLDCDSPIVLFFATESPLS
jgi:FkbM family methyltransferase